MGDTVNSEVSRKTAKERGRLFVAAYLANGRNATQAAIAAGFSEKSAKSQGSRLLTRGDVKAAIEGKTAKLEEKHNLTADRVLRELECLAFSDLSEAYDAQGNLKPIHEIPEGVRRAIAGVKVFEEYEGAGRERTKVGEVREVKLWSKAEALRDAMKHLGLLKDTVQHQGTVFHVVDPYAVPAAGAPVARTVPPAPAAAKGGR